MSEVTRLTRSVGLSTANFEHNDAEVLICSRTRQRVEAAKEISSKVVGDEFGVTSISKAKQPLGEIIDDLSHSWYKIDEELGRIREFGLNRSTRNRITPFDTLMRCYNFFGG
jgi:hypothetical protein